MTESGLDAAQLAELSHEQARELKGMTRHEALYIEAHRISRQIADVMMDYAAGDVALLGLLTEAARPLACLQAELKRRKMQALDQDCRKRRGEVSSHRSRKNLKVYKRMLKKADRRRIKLALCQAEPDERRGYGRTKYDPWNWD